MLEDRIKEYFKSQFAATSGGAFWITRLIRDMQARIKELEVFFSENMHQLERQSKTIQELEERLEMVYVYDGDGNKIPWTKDMPDGIAARDITIKYLEEENTKLREIINFNLSDYYRITIKHSRPNPLGGKDLILILQPKNPM